MGYTYRQQKENFMNEDYNRIIAERKSNHSYQINNKITEIFTNKSLSNHKVFIIAGGESLKEFDFSILDKEKTITINKAFQIYPKSTINYSMDSEFYDNMKNGSLDTASNCKLWDKWLQYSGTRVFLTPLQFKEFGKETYVVRRNIGRSLNPDNLENGIYGGLNSGWGAIALAVALGSTDIYLLGYDMQVKTQSHFHGGYGPRDLVEFNRKLSEYRDEISSFLPLLNYFKVKVTNLNPNSGLQCFEFKNIKEVLGGNNANI